MSVASAEGARQPVQGMALMVLAMTVIPVMDGMAKLLSANYPTMQIVWARYFFHVLLLAPFVVWRFGFWGAWPRRPALQVVRGSLLFGATISFFSAIATMPLADTLAIVFIYPFIVTAFSPLLLGDQVGKWRWGAVIVGFLGALIIFRPGVQALKPAMLWAASAGICYACYVLITRKMAGTDKPSVTLLMTGLVGMLAATAMLPFVWTTPTPAGLAMMVGLGVLAAFGHYLIIVAHEQASAPQLAPYAYVEIVSATIVGFLLFGDLPALLTWVGMAIIMASGIVIAWREARLARLERLAPPPRTGRQVL